MGNHFAPWFSPEKKGTAEAVPRGGVQLLHSWIVVLIHRQMVFHAEGTRYAVDPDTRNGLVHFVLHRTVQADMPVVHDDANRTRRISRILAQHRVAVDGACRANPKAVIEQ